MRLAVAFVLSIVAAAPAAADPAAAQSRSSGPEIVAEIHVHGNLAARLRDADRFDSVEVLKRFASLSDPTRIALVIVVDEGPVSVDWGRAGSEPRVTRRRGVRALDVMFLPIVDFEDGYGLAYGVRVALPGFAGRRSRLSVPATWGGDRRAGIELEKFVGSGTMTRLTTGASASQRTHPSYDADASARRLFVRAERELRPWLRVGAGGAIERHVLLERTDRVIQGGADVTLDTRVDPLLARNAIYARAAWDRLSIRDGRALSRVDLEGRGYIGLAGQSVAVVRAVRRHANGPLPVPLQFMLGGMDTLRGFRTGSRVGDGLVAGSLEIRVPLTSPLSFGKIGVSALTDVGATTLSGERLTDRRFDTSVGGALWFSAAVVRMNVAVARGIGGGTRAHFGTTLVF